MKRSGLTGPFFLSVLLLLLFSCEDVFRENLESKVKLATEALDTPEVSGPDSTGNSKPTWEWTVPDGTVNFRYQLDGTAGSWTETSGNQATSHTPSIELEEGEHTFYVQALGPSGKWSGSGSKTTLIDLSAPTVSAGEDIPWTNTAVTLAGTSGDTMGITSLWEVVPENPGIVFSDASSLTSTVEGPADTEGSYTLKLTCTDALGHYATDEVILNWDAKAPVPGNEGVLTFSDETIDSLTLNWTAAGDLNKAAIELEYKIIGSDSVNLNTLTDCQTTGDGRFTVTDWTAGITSAKAVGLNPAGTYYFNILVRDTLKQESLYSKKEFTFDPVPQNVSVLLQPSVNLKISWAAVAGVDGYRVYRSDSDNGPYTQIGNVISATEYTDGGCAAAQTYWYQVRAYKNLYESHPSSAASGVIYYTSQIGPAGGRIFYVDYTDTYPGWTYLEMADVDQSSNIRWSNGLSNVITGASGTAIGTGAGNTAAILNKQGDGTYAAKVCADLVRGEYDDWFLPSKDELNLMYGTTATYGANFSASNYWSSSEDSISNAWMHNFGLDGDPHTNMKVDLYSVRAIRAF